jgi:UDP-glucose 4-epimerase
MLKAQSDIHYQDNIKILATYGLGFIGSHTVVELQNEGFEVVIIDNLSNSTEDVLKGIVAITGKMPIFEKLDLKKQLFKIFKRHSDVSGVIHFAASKAVRKRGKSLYCIMKNNSTLIYLLQELQQKKSLILFLVLLVQYMVKLM